MIFFGGIYSKVKEAGYTPPCRCPACGNMVSFLVTVDYLTPHIFFIPTIRLRTRYLATCPSCASVMELRREVGREVERGRPVTVEQADLTVLPNSRGPHCHNCGEGLYPGQSYCGRCGTPL